MKEVIGDLWSYPADVICVTTNGCINPGCLAVMGKGVALEAAKRYPLLPAVLGKHLMEKGNHVHFLMSEMITKKSYRAIFSFPTKYHWRDNSDLELIKRSCLELRVALAQYPFVPDYWTPRGPTVTVLPRPGCGLGGLDWEKDVQPILLVELDDPHFVVISKE